jgi:prepilin-type N-terminal cleavage/methylation domain-containing protein
MDIIKRSQAGVTLIEMLVVVAIIAVVSSVIMFNYSDFSTNVSVRTLSQEIALAIRKSQTYATSVRSVDGTTIQDSSAYAGYGISFSTNDTPTDQYFPSSRRFVLFVDIPVGSGTESDYAGTYTQTQSQPCGAPTSSSNECIESFDITTADKIVAICASPDASTYSSTDLSTCVSKGSVDISFKRPSPDAKILYTSENGTSTQAAYAQLIIESAKGLKRAVTVWNTGQISVQ